MMKPSEHANLLSIFAFIFAGIQGLMLLFIGLYALLMGGLSLFAAFDTRGSNDATGLIFMFVLAFFLFALCAIGLTVVILNIRMGKRLRSGRRPTQRQMIVTSIFNFCSFFCGGVFILPFGTAMGVYGLYFALSDMGKAYLAGMPDPQTNMMPPPPPPQAYSAPQNSEPYKWQ